MAIYLSVLEIKAFIANWRESLPNPLKKITPENVLVWNKTDINKDCFESSGEFNLLL